MRFRTGLNLIDLTAEVSRRLEHVKFPFLIMHDPGDCEYLCRAEENSSPPALPPSACCLFRVGLSSCGAFRRTVLHVGRAFVIRSRRARVFRRRFVCVVAVAVRDQAV